MVYPRVTSIFSVFTCTRAFLEVSSLYHPIENTVAIRMKARYTRQIIGRIDVIPCIVCILIYFLRHCLFSNREGLGTSLQIMGLATIDPHSQKENTKIQRIPKFGVNQASFD